MQWIRDSIVGVRSSQCEAVSTYKKIVDTTVESQFKDFQHGPRFRKCGVLLSDG